MRIGIYSPYLDTFGGGEKYMLSIAEILSKENDVDLLLGTHLYNANIKQIKTKIESFHNLDLSAIKIVKAPIGEGSLFLSRIFFLRKYDYLFFLTDGSIFFSTARNNIVHFQVPFKNQNARSFYGKVKLSSWKLAIYNSKFTKQIVEKSWNLRGKVIYPPVLVEDFKPLKKKKQIVSVGRFSAHMKDKKHGLLIDIFKQIISEGSLKDWSLHLAGGVGEGDSDYVRMLKDQAKNFQIFLYPNISYSDLITLYGESSIYWHAKGFEEGDPKDFEHFGITTVEAMAAGCVPVVINKGGQAEIVEDKISGFLWHTLEQLKKNTLKLVSDNNLMVKVSKKASARASLFNKQKFSASILALVSQ